MPIFYRPSPDQSALSDTPWQEEDNWTGGNNHDHKNKERAHDAATTDTLSRSKSPDAHVPRMTSIDGRPISREEIIEHIKRCNSPALSFKKSPSPKSLSRSPSCLQSPREALLPSPHLDQVDDEGRAYDNGMTIERPRSALHSGDFRPPPESPQKQQDSEQSRFSAAQEFFPTEAIGISFDYQSNRGPPVEPTPIPRSVFSFLPPTTPLVHSSSSVDLESLSDRRSPSPTNRRHTFSPLSFQGFRSAAATPLPSRTPQTQPYQAHQPRRSISIPQTPSLRPRGLSISTEASPLHHAPMVGSYEESILRGRMSTLPSRPLDFIAQVGVLGKGKCKPSLRCPSHVIVPFPAVFYSYNSTARPSDNSPSPYVGHIDIEHTFPSYPGKSPQGGCYRIPPQGQLQIIIKNPNKTAVKLFLVPYDLSDMQPGQKTFIRQRSYSAGPFIDMPISSRSNFGTDRPEAALSHGDDPTERPTLRYLIHLNICCPSKGRYFLYKSMRVVFANRVPDGKEKLRNETQLPDPRYSSYKPLGSVTSSPLPMRKPHEDRRRSTPFAFAMDMDSVDGIASTPSARPRPKPAPMSRTNTEPLFSYIAEPARMALDPNADVMDDVRLDSSPIDLVLQNDGSRINTEDSTSAGAQSFGRWLDERWGSQS